MRPMHPLLTPTADTLPIGTVLEDFAAQGFARLGKVLTPEGANALAQRAVEIMESEFAVPGVFYQPEPESRQFEHIEFGAGWQGPSVRYRKLERLEVDPLFASWIENPLFERLALAHLGDQITLYRTVLWNKAAHGGMAVPWHQDDGRFWGLDQSPSLQIWTALDPAGPDAGCLEVMPGSHLHGLASREGGTVRPEALAAAHADTQKHALVAEQGESILVHNHLWHRTGSNKTGQPRRALSISFLAGDTRCRRKRRRPRTFKPMFST